MNNLWYNKTRKTNPSINGRYFTCGGIGSGAFVLYSNDGLEWSRLNISGITDGSTLYSVYPSPDMNYMLYATTDGIYRSVIYGENAILESGATGSYRKIRKHYGTLIAVGNNGVISHCSNLSGTGWTSTNVGSATLSNIDSFEDISFDRVGVIGSLGYFRTSTLSQIQNNNWTNLNSNLPSDMRNTTSGAIGHNNTRWTIAGNYGAYTNNYGDSFTSFGYTFGSSATTYCYGNTLDGPMHVIAGNSGNIWYSQTGLSWTLYTYPSRYNIYGSIFDGDKFILAAANGFLWSRTGKTQWDYISVGQGPFYDIIYISD